MPKPPLAEPMVTRYDGLAAQFLQFKHAVAAMNGLSVADTNATGGELSAVGEGVGDVSIVQAEPAAPRSLIDRLLNKKPKEH